MNSRIYPTRKRYTYELPTIYGTVVLQFMQATSNESANELGQFSNLQFKEFAQKYVKMLQNRCISYDKKRYIPKFLLRIAIKKDLAPIISEIMYLRHKNWSSLYEGFPEMKPKGFRNRALFNTDAFLAEKANCGIEEARDRLTNEQIGYLLDDSKWDYYESFDEGKKLNDEILQKNNRILTAQEEELLQYMKDYKERAKEYAKDKSSSL